jgi:hypothetical protein
MLIYNVDMDTRRAMWLWVSNIPLVWIVVRSSLAFMREERM